jgi:hypothetical protein
VFAELLPGNALIKSVTLYTSIHIYIYIYIYINGEREIFFARFGVGNLLLPDPQSERRLEPRIPEKRVAELREIGKVNEPNPERKGVC